MRLSVFRRPASRLSPTLSAFRDVEKHGNGFRALGIDPWLSIEDACLSRAAGQIVEITYRASLWDEPVRPVFRFETADGRFFDRIAPGPVAGAGIWIGRVPRDMARTYVSPTCRLGAFSFVIESIRKPSWLELLAFGFRENPRSTRSMILTRMIGWAPESDVNLAWAIGATAFAGQAAWSAGGTEPWTSWASMRRASTGGMGRL